MSFLAQGKPFDPSFFLFLAAMIAIFYFLILRPQKKKDKQRTEMLAQIQKGDKVVTIGGIHGEVVTIKEKYVVLLVDQESNTTIKFSRQAIHGIAADTDDVTPQ